MIDPTALEPVSGHPFGTALNEHQFHRHVEDLLSLPELMSSRHRTHHFDLSEYDHLVSVARTAHRLSRYVKADARVCARAGLLHDLGAHWFNTLAPCTLALRLQESPGVCHAIKAHTLLPELPRTREAWVIIAADLLTSAQECRFVLRRTRDRAGYRLREDIARRRKLLHRFAGGRVAGVTRFGRNTRRRLIGLPITRAIRRVAGA
ncbi:MAG: HD domain-containing protein [Chloroflexi bacterium]|nr:HD domain-containing protein [Chloroflexota bacterium]